MPRFIVPLVIPLALVLAGAPPFSLGAQHVSPDNGMIDPRSVEARPAVGAIEIDGSVDDPGWEGATRITGFVERTPREGATPPVATEVLLTYDESNLYVAFLAHDPNPGDLRAALQPRNQRWSDSHVGALVTDRRLEGGGSGTSASLDAQFRFGEMYSLSAISWRATRRSRTTRS